MKLGDMKDMMQRAQEMQSRMGDLQKELATRRFEATAGGGMVKVTVSGALRVISIDIEDAIARGDDKTMLQDLVASAVNAALTKAQEGVGKEVASMQQSMMAGMGD
ncbi:MAG: YbaB/EbfC family nucleoid-associated protein [Myxococcota bacterium]